jgi:hypothetical protein
MFDILYILLELAFHRNVIIALNENKFSNINTPSYQSLRGESWRSCSLCRLMEFIRAG